MFNIRLPAGLIEVPIEPIPSKRDITVLLHLNDKIAGIQTLNQRLCFLQSVHDENSVANPITGRLPHDTVFARLTAKGRHKTSHSKVDGSLFLGDGGARHSHWDSKTAICKRVCEEIKRTTLSKELSQGYQLLPERDLVHSRLFNRDRAVPESDQPR
ncbi:Hypothetical protein DEACI_3309 [Acididesulfobacillus acetoxydans]|uniref:Uncharacterized protein n=1 Tax=Acididesulfobacillus acetoxydans TaxID=1561005 RepID=A0A8S0X6L1_9FIRM|nr:Hypothetical protein DEACI_3309 [Acididesulfobacillus acetoxydans]CEJ09173.1 Hypothetical protein DEACI_3656 [Acididesulfobacillus acetoxydans]